MQNALQDSCKDANTNIKYLADLITTLESCPVQFAIDQVKQTITVIETCVEQVVADYATVKDDCKNDLDQKFMTDHADKWRPQIIEDSNKIKLRAIKAIAVAEKAILDNTRAAHGSPRKTRRQLNFGDEEEDEEGEGGNESGNNKGRMKLCSVLKPKNDLSSEMKFTEFKMWKKKFQAYYGASHVESEAPETQRQILDSCMNDNLCEIFISNCIRTFFGSW